MGQTAEVDLAFISPTGSVFLHVSAVGSKRLHELNRDLTEHYLSTVIHLLFWRTEIGVVNRWGCEIFCLTAIATNLVVPPIFTVNRLRILWSVECLRFESIPKFPSCFGHAEIAHPHEA